ncbi:transcription antitermination factor NusB [Haloimpatiens sp. FM7315]|uniref:transcription antitermination factor NusB n=1 Tax=Haloimpatiens sp. FM7315 TaxID=3298609 RepID=UPI0035A3600C
MNRRKSRELAMKLIYEINASKSDYIDVISNYKENTDEDLSNIDFSYITKMIKGIKDNGKYIDDIIEEHSSNWKINRISKVNLSILRLAIYEIKFLEDVPDKVAVNEAIELAKKYSEDKASSFINGILGNLIKK